MLRGWSWSLTGVREESLPPSRTVWSQELSSGRHLGDLAQRSCLKQKGLLGTVWFWLENPPSLSIFWACKQMCILFFVLKRAVCSPDLAAHESCSKADKSGDERYHFTHIFCFPPWGSVTWNTILGTQAETLQHFPSYPRTEKGNRCWASHTGLSAGILCAYIYVYAKKRVSAKLFYRFKSYL